ncbi:MAG TPA: hypothetical protein VFE29_08515 [Terriglobia bacterium]|nr:hypothetical protein [Terriglobia bacterium]
MHLSSEQVSEWALGDRRPEVERHLDDCRQCREELTRLQDSLRAFRQSVHDWAAVPASTIVPASRMAGSLRSLPWTWAGVTALAMTFVLLPLYLDVRQAEREAENARDSLLLDQVQARLAQTVPHSMEPLMELMIEEREGGQ